MQIQKVRIENFRSLSNIEFEMENYLVIFGKNNEGKSNVLKAIKRYNDIIKSIQPRNKMYTKDNGIKLNDFYFNRLARKFNSNIENDIPIDIMNAKRTKKMTTICLTYVLTDEEVNKLNNELTSTSKASHYLEVTIFYDRDLYCKVGIKLKKNGRTLSVLKNMFIILSFLNNNFSIDYIPTIRTEEHTVNIIEKIISDKLNKLEESEDYISAIDKINELQSEVLNSLSKSITPDMKRYISNIDSVEIKPREQQLKNIIRNNYKIIIDDGKKTNLIDKGDGIKSLIALSLLQENDSTNGLLMIDEPEAHLHSAAIKELENKIKNDSNQQQVIIASHHQIFVDRNHMSRNMILSSGKLKSKTNIRMIREELGVGLGENLLNSELVLIVEGETDKSFLMRYIQLNNEKLFKSIKENKFIIDVSRGTSKLESKLQFYTSSFCKCICLLDNDEASNKVIKTILSKKIIDEKYIFKTPLEEKNESELENLYDDEFMFQTVDDFFGVLRSNDRKQQAKKERLTKQLGIILDGYGKDFDKSEEAFKWELINKSSEFTNVSYVSSEGLVFLNSIMDVLEKSLFG